MGQNFDFTSYNNIKRVSEEELEGLWNSYLSNRINKEARDALIVQYIYLVRYVVGRVKLMLPQTVSLEDIVGYGIEGLIEAIERYIPQKATRFETYALIRIRGAIIDKVRSEDFLPRSVRRKLKQLKEAQEYLKQELNRMPTTRELANYVDMDEDKVTQILSEDVILTSIYEKRTNNDESMEIIDTIEDTKKSNPQDNAEGNQIKKELENALQRLPERERIIMVLYYQENMTLKEIGNTMKMSESRACQLHAQGIMKLKNILSERHSARMRQSIIS